MVRTEKEPLITIDDLYLKSEQQQLVYYYFKRLQFLKMNGWYYANDNLDIVCKENTHVVINNIIGIDGIKEYDSDNREFKFCFNEFYVQVLLDFSIEKFTIEINYFYNIKARYIWFKSITLPLTNVNISDDKKTYIGYFMNDYDETFYELEDVELPFYTIFKGNVYFRIDEAEYNDFSDRDLIRIYINDIFLNQRNIYFKVYKSNKEKYEEVEMKSSNLLDYESCRHDHFYDISSYPEDVYVNSSGFGANIRYYSDMWLFKRFEYSYLVNRNYPESDFIYALDIYTYSLQIWGIDKNREYFSSLFYLKFNNLLLLNQPLLISKGLYLERDIIYLTKIGNTTKNGTSQGISYTNESGGDLKNYEIRVSDIYFDTTKEEPFSLGFDANVTIKGEIEMPEGSELTCNTLAIV